MMFFALPYFLESARNLEIIGFVIGIIFWFQMFRLCATREPNTMGKYAWLFFMIVLPGISSLTYFFVRVVNVRS